MSDGDASPVSDAEPSTASDREASSDRLGSDPDWTPAFLTSIRETPRRRAGALIVAAVVGLGLAWIHWLGLFAAGALVGLASKTLPRAVIGGVVFGVFVLVVTVLTSPVMGPREFVGMAPPAYVAIGAAVVAPAWGSLLRGVV